MEEQEYNSKSQPWKDRYESFRVDDNPTVGGWIGRAIRFDRITKIAEAEGKELNYTMAITPEGRLIIEVECR